MMWKCINIPQELGRTQRTRIEHQHHLHQMQLVENSGLHRSSLGGKLY